MTKYLFFTLCVLFFNCSSDKTEDTLVKKDSIAPSVQDTVATVGDSIKTAINWDEPDPFKIAKLEEYIASWDNRYFPMPDVSMLKRYSQIDPGYLYLTHNFDSLHAKRFTQYHETTGMEEDELNTIPCAWVQQFKTDITYTMYTCNDGGESISIRTKCPDKKVLVRLIDILYHDTENAWNSDSSQYNPIKQEAGCYYTIEENDAGGYDISYICGC